MGHAAVYVSGQIRVFGFHFVSEMVPVMTRSRSFRLPLKFVAGPLVLSVAMALTPAHHACESDNAGLVVPEGFCATLVASNAGAVRQLAVAPNGDLYAALAGPPGGVLAFRDKDGDGKPDERASFGD